MAYSPLAIANEFIVMAASDGSKVEHMKLQKLVHFAHGYALAEGNELSNEEPEVWKYGPVFSSLYAELKYHGAEPIRQPENENIFLDPPRIDPNDQRSMDAVRLVWQKYKRYTGFQLSDKTHAPGTPWHQTVKNLNGKVPLGTKITNELIKSHYMALEELKPS